MATKTYPVPSVNLKNWRSAEMVLERVQNDVQRRDLAELLRGLGVHGSAGLSYAAQCACWLTGAYGRTPERRATLRTAEALWIDARVLEACIVLVRAEPERWPRAQKHVRG